MGKRRVRGVAAAFALSLAMVVGLAPAADAHPWPDRRGLLGRVLGDQWRVLLEIPGTVGDDQHPFNVGACLRYDHVVTPSVGIGGATEITCRTRFGEPVYVTGRSFEASVVEAPEGQQSQAALEASALAQLGDAPPVVCYDGRRLPVVKVISGLVDVRLPQPNLFERADLRSTQLVAAGYVTVVLPPPGRHVITIEQADGSFRTVNTILVERGRWHGRPDVAVTTAHGHGDRACRAPRG